GLLNRVLDVALGVSAGVTNPVFDVDRAVGGEACSRRRRESRDGYPTARVPARRLGEQVRAVPPEPLREAERKIEVERPVRGRQLAGAALDVAGEARV